MTYETLKVRKLTGGCGAELLGVDVKSMSNRQWDEVQRAFAEHGVVFFREQKLKEAKGSGDAARALAFKAAGIESAAVLGFTSAIGACGGYLIPRGFGASIAVTGGPHLALAIFLTFYVTCVALTWWHYMRKSFLARRAPSLAEARV